MYVILAFQLIQFTGADNQKIDVNPDEVVTVRPLRSLEHFGKDIKCLIHTTDGKFIAVTEDCDTVKRAVEDAKNKG